MISVWTKVKFKLGLLIEDFLRSYLPDMYYKRKLLNTIKNHKNHMRALDNKKPGDIPANVAIEINNTCNLNCVMCSTQQAKRKKGEISVELFENTVRQIARLGQRHLIVHTVGEPFFYSKLGEIFRICKKYGLNLRFTTNGLLLHKHINLFKEYPGLVSHISFSIDGATKETFEKIRKGGRFKQLLNNLELIYNYNKNATKNHRISILLQVCISEDNFNEIPLFSKVFEKYFTQEKINFQFLSNLSASHAESDYYKSKNLNTNRLHRLNAPCNLFWHAMFVLWDGNVSACCRDYNGELIVGNIFQKTIPEIWKDNLYEHYRDMHRRRKTKTVPLCRDCWCMAPEITTIMHYYIHYLFKKFKNKPDEFYLKRIRDKIDYLNNNYTDDFVFQGF